MTQDELSEIIHRKILKHKFMLVHTHRSDWRSHWHNRLWRGRRRWIGYL